MIQTDPVPSGIVELPTSNLTIMLVQPDDLHLAIRLVGDGVTAGPVIVPCAATMLQRLGEQLRDAPTLARDEQQKLGVQLGDLLLPATEIRPAFQAVWRNVAEHNGSLRLRLQCDSPALAVPPWEYLQVPLIPDGLPLPLLGDPRLSLVRVGSEPQDVVLPVTDDHLPLEVLLILAGPPDQPPLNLGKEQERVEGGLQQMPVGTVTILPPLSHARWSDLQNVLAGDRHADLLHFAGHGYYQADGVGLIFHDDEDPNVSHLVSASDIATELRGKGVKVVVLSACESARVDRNVWNGVAQQLLAAGVPAVVAMQFPVGDDEAQAFAGGFYTALATRATVDVAVAEGRLRMVGSVSLTTGWGCPVIYMRTTQARLFHYQVPLPPALQAAQSALVVNQALKRVAGNVIGLDLGTVRLQGGQLVVNQQIESIDPTGSVVGMRAGTLELLPSANGQGTNGHKDGATPEAIAPSPPDSAATIPPPRPADPVAAAHLESIEAVAPPATPLPFVDNAAVSPALQALFDDTRTFVERPNPQSTIKAFLTSHNRSIVVVGPPGCGKTAFVTWLVVQAHATLQPWLYHFCGIDDGDNPQQFIQQLASQLQTVLPAYKVLAPVATGNATLILQNNIQIGANSGNVEGIHTGAISLGEVHPREAFRRLIQEPLQAYPREVGPDHKPLPLVIVVDALDRAWEWDGGQSGNIVSLLSDAQDMPAWINFVCTARPGAAVQSLRTQGGVAVLNMGEDAQSTRDDIIRYLNVQWKERLEANAQAKLAAMLQTLPIYAVLPVADRLSGLATRVALASDGSFLYARRFVDTLHSALSANGSPEGIDPATLLQEPDQLDAALSDAYAEVCAQLQHTLAEVSADADADVLAVLGVAFVPMSEYVLATLTGYSPIAVQHSLERLNSVLAAPSGVEPPCYALYSRSFADYLRTTLPEGGRVWDRKLAEELENQADNDNDELRSYRAHYRWRHLQRGFQLATSTVTNAGDPAAPLPLLANLAQLEEQMPDPLLRARVLRAQALALLDPGSLRADAWTTAVALLQSAEAGIMRARALAPLRRGKRLHFTDRQRSPQTEAALAELERTLLARGDAFTQISDQLLGTDELRPIPAGGPLRSIVELWGIVQRLPALLYSLIPLLRSGLRWSDLLKSLVRICHGRDWSVVRLLVRALTAYTRAAMLADRRDDATSVEEIKDRIAQLYVRFGALDGASSAFNDLLASPAAVDRPWQEALWRLRLGEVLSRLDQSGRATPLLEAALRQFMTQDAPMPLARTYNALVYVHVRQAELRRLRGDDQGAANYEDAALRCAEDGVAAWERLSTLEGDDVTQVDPAAGRSRLLGVVWRLSHSSQLAEEQQRRANTLLTPNHERHFPQRFEHPLLHWFQVSTLVITPLLLLFGLLWVVQLPSTLDWVSPRAKTSLQPPLVDLLDFPDNLMGSTGMNPQVSEQAKALILPQATGNVQGSVMLHPTAPLIHAIPTLLGIVRGGSSMLLLYVLCGLLFILVSEPNKFQRYRPGRLILRSDAIIWRGTPTSGSRWRTWRMLFLQSLLSLQRRIWRGHPAPGLTPTLDGAGELQAEQSLAYTEVKRTLVMERRVNGMVIYDLSHRVLLPKKPSTPSLVIDGFLARYDELVSELEHRIAPNEHDDHQTTGELFRSWAGGLFTLTFAGVLTFLVVVILRPAVLSLRPWHAPFHLNELYILATPGLMVPLFWWFVWQPLRNWMAYHANWWGVLIALASALLSSSLLRLGLDLSFIGLNPDLLLPLLVISLSLTVFSLLWQRRFSPPSVGRGWANRLMIGVLTVVAFVPLGFGVAQMLRDLEWYGYRVAGNLQLEAAGTDHQCAPQLVCDLLKYDATYWYNRMIPLRPSDPEGYGGLGFAALKAGNLDGAIKGFNDALRLGGSPFFSGGYRNIKASLGATYAQQAQALTKVPSAQLFADALGNNGFGGVLPYLHTAIQLGPIPQGFEQCFPDHSQSGTATEQLPVQPGDEQYALQDADIRYARALRQILAFEQQRPVLANYYVQGQTAAPSDCLPILAWEDLGVAIRIYTAIVNNPSTNDQVYHDRMMSLGAAWLARAGFPASVRPVDYPGIRTAYLRAQDAYREATKLYVDPKAQAEAEAGLAWTAILLNAPDDALLPLKQAHADDPHDPRYPTLSGLAWWLESGQLPQSTPDGRLQRMLLHAVEQYTMALTQTLPMSPTLGQYYATRSILFYNLRKTPINTTVGSADADVSTLTDDVQVGHMNNAPLPPCTTNNYDLWMQRAMSDMDQALDAATIQHRPATETAGFYYWRGRLHTALGLTWQERFCGDHPWRMILPQYVAAVNDFTIGTTLDRDPKDVTRSQVYIGKWLAWSRYLAHNASEMALAEETITDALAHPSTSTVALARAREALQVIDLVDPTANDSAPRPDYFFLSGFVALATGQPVTNTHVTSPKPLGAAALYEQAINDIPNYVPTSMIPKVYTDALQSINQLVGQSAVLQPVRREAQAIQSCLRQAQVGVARISCTPK